MLELQIATHSFYLYCLFRTLVISKKLWLWSAVIAYTEVELSVTFARWQMIMATPMRHRPCQQPRPSSAVYQVRLPTMCAVCIIHCFARCCNQLVCSASALSTCDLCIWFFVFQQLLHGNCALGFACCNFFILTAQVIWTFQCMRLCHYLNDRKLAAKK